MGRENDSHLDEDSYTVHNEVIYQGGSNLMELHILARETHRKANGQRDFKSEAKYVNNLVAALTGYRVMTKAVQAANGITSRTRKDFYKRYKYHRLNLGRGVPDRQEEAKVNQLALEKAWEKAHPFEGKFWEQELPDYCQVTIPTDTDGSYNPNERTTKN